MKKQLLTALLVAFPFLTMAHEGHGEFHNTLWHYVFSFWHLLPVVLMIYLIILGIRTYGQRNKSSIK